MRVSFALFLAVASVVLADSTSTVSTFTSNGQACYVISRPKTDSSTSTVQSTTSDTTSSTITEVTTSSTTSDSESTTTTSTEAPSTTSDSTTTSESGTTTSSDSTLPTTTGPITCPNIYQDPSFENVPLSYKSSNNFNTDVWSFAGSGATIASNGDNGASTTTYGSVYAFVTSGYNTNTDGSRIGPTSTISQAITGLSPDSSYTVSYRYGASAFSFGAASVSGSGSGQGGPSRTAGCSLIMRFADQTIDDLELTFLTDFPPPGATALQRSVGFIPGVAEGQLQLSFQCLERNKSPGIFSGQGSFLIDEFELGITDQVCV